MSSNLEDDRDNLRHTLRRLVESLASVRWPDVEVATIQELCTRYRRLAICELLLDANTEAFADCLYNSGRAYLALLQRIDRSALQSQYHFCTSRAQPFLDSLAADDVDTARAMAPWSASNWARGDEYEEDFRYMRFLMDVLAHGTTSSQASACLQGLRVVATGFDSARLGVCESLQATDARAFDLAMVEFLQQREECVAEERGNPSADPEFLRTEAPICIEGIALVKLARVLGMEVRIQAPGIPRWAFTRRKKAFPPPDAWREPWVSYAG